MSVPVILIHRGNSNYLYDTLYQLRQSNPGVQIYLLGTIESKIYASLATHIMYEEYMQESDVFAQRYRHFSTNSPEFELICLQRWFVLKAFMQSMKLGQCLYIDSDVLVYSAVDNLAQEVGEYGMTICGISGHTNFVRYTVLVDFCTFLLRSYQDEAATEKLRQDFQKFLTHSPAGGISDMTFLYQYSKLNPDRVLNINYFGNDEAFDVTIDTGEGEYEMHDEIKKVIWKSKKPYCRRLSNNRLILHHTLHFQGRTKKKMSSFVISKSLLYSVSRKYYLSVLIVQKLKRKIFGA